MRIPSVTGLKYALVILVSYAAVLSTGPYGVNDDYPNLYRVHAGIFDPAHNEQTGMGRLAASWLFELGFALCHGSVAHLVYLRLAALAGMILYALVLHRGLSRSGYSGNFILTVVLLTTLSPAFGVYAAWASGFLSPYALTLCVMAGILLEDSPNARWPRWPHIIGAFLLVVLSCSIWQAAVPMALFVGFARAWNDPTEDSLRRVWKQWFILGFSALIYLAAQRFAIRAGWITSVGSERMVLATDATGKLHVLGEVLRAGFSSWGRFHPGLPEWLVMGTTSLGVIASIFANPRAPLVPRRRVVLATLMILASMASSLAVAEDNATFRILAVLYATVTFLALDGFHRWLRPVPGHWQNRAGFALIVAMMICAHWHVRDGIVEPNYREYTGVREQIRRQFTQMPPRLVYLLPPPTLLGEGWLTASREYGLLSSPFWWVTSRFCCSFFMTWA